MQKNNQSQGKKKQVIGVVIVALIFILGLLWYYQQEGYVDIFPTAEDREAKKLLKIDESKFSRADGLTDEQYQSKLDELKTLRQDVLDNPSVGTWFAYGGALDFFNDHEGAIAAWKKALEYQEVNFVALNNIATNYQYFIEDYPKAEEYYLRALEIRADYPNAFEGLADLYQYNWAEQEEKFLPLIERALVNDRLNTVRYYNRVIRYLAKKGEFETAQEYLDRLKQVNSEYAQTIIEDYDELN